MPPAVIARVKPVTETAVAQVPAQTREFQSWLTQQDPAQPAPATASVEQFMAPDPNNTLPPEAQETPTMFASQSASSEERAFEPAAVTPPTTTAPAASATASTPGGVIKPGSPENRFVGAGILQRAPGQANAFVLMTSSGRVLADLKPTAGVQFENHLGQQVGVLGSRWSEKEKRDIIEVNALERVRLR